MDQDQLIIVCISDTHCHKIEKLPPGDILVCCGDFSYSGLEEEIYLFIEWISKQPFTHKIVIAGNHDLSLDTIGYEDHLKKKYHRYYNFDHKALKLRVQNNPDFIYLENCSIIVEGYKFWGSPYSLEFCDWGFSLEPTDAEKFWEQIDKDSEIILTHGPPYSYGDRVKQGQLVGDQALLNAVRKIKPLFHMFGHIHEGYGLYEGIGEDKGITFINCSINNYNYKPVNAPIVVKVPKKQ